MGIRKVTARELLATDKVDGVELGPIMKEPDSVTIRLGTPGERTISPDVEIEVQE